MTVIPTKTKRKRLIGAIVKPLLAAALVICLLAALLVFRLRINRTGAGDGPPGAPIVGRWGVDPDDPRSTIRSSHMVLSLYPDGRAIVGTDSKARWLLVDGNLEVTSTTLDMLEGTFGGDTPIGSPHSFRLEDGDKLVWEAGRVTFVLKRFGNL